MRTNRHGIVSLLLIATALLSVSCGSKKEQVAVSPDGKITVYAEAGKYFVKYLDNDALTIAKIGYDSLSAKTELKFAQAVTADYTMLMGKRSHCTNQANEYTAALDKNTNLIFRVYNNGIAFRYQFHDVAEPMAIPTELTSYEIKEGTRRWFMQWCESYEGFFTPDTTAKQKAVFSFSGTFVKDGWCCRWSYPALIQPASDVYVLLSESDVNADNSASCLWNDSGNIEIFNVRPDKNETEITGSYLTPWRVAVIGNLADIVESTLITDAAADCKLDDVSWIEPGVVSWIYWAYNHGSNDYEIIKKYVDLAVSLKLPYMLIDAEWDEMKNGKTIEDAVKYAVDHNVKPLIWYSSSIGWIDGAPGPKFRLNKPEDREKEFAWLEKIGVAGVKIDFFSGDNQFNMNYCIDLLQSAAKHHLTVNFHGATLPRGWQRTYPNLLSTEAVYGAEWYNNGPTFTNKAAAHNATLPFTRNVVGSMDYTPCAFSDSQFPHITSNAHELALTVLYESGLQHIADRPESLLAQPKEVLDFFGQLPAAWNDTKFVGGYPADYVVVARECNGKWYVAGINGSDSEREIAVNLDFIKDGKFTMFADSSNADSPWAISNIDANSLPKMVKMLPRGGFVIAQND
ncbi:MAG: glycoside hydrolase family 97 catalytic domain-containing protein [Salinivirgaceae bacterium]|nr:glycoside hydrolase family 97 catalytic domain-containing protein [Salinivirgaceae bacterium]